MAKQIQTIKLPSPHAFLRLSEEYFLAAEALLPSNKLFESPVYFLYCHSIESALKAYLNIKKPVQRKTHQLDLLMKECRMGGLKISVDITNMLTMLEEENSVHGFRYFYFASTARPSLKYLQEGAKEILTAIKNEFSKIKTGKENDAVIKIVFSRPESQK